MSTGALSDNELRLLDAYWRAANYLSVGQIYLLANPLLREPLGDVEHPVQVVHARSRHALTVVERVLHNNVPAITPASPAVQCSTEPPAPGVDGRS